MMRKLVSTLILMLLVCSLGGAPGLDVVKNASALQAAEVVPCGDWTHYHNYTEIVETLLTLNATYPTAIDVFSIGKSWENRTIFCARLTNESNVHPKPELFFVGYHHAQEPITAELALYFIVQAATGFGNNKTITHMLNYAEIYVVPALNVDGIEAFRNNNWQRKNSRPIDEDGDGLFDEDPPDDANGNGFIEYLVRRRFVIPLGVEGADDDGDGRLNEDWVGGVDLNRNYGYAWDMSCESGSTNPSSERYKGPEPFSEPETQAIRGLTLQHDFKYAVSFHSGAQCILYPWACVTEPTPDDRLLREICSNMAALTGAVYGQMSSPLMFTASGAWDDWMYANRSAYSFTCEIYRNGSALKYSPGPTSDTLWQRGIFQYANPDTHDIESVVRRWLPVFTYLSSRAISEANDVAVDDVTPQQITVVQGRPMQASISVTNQGSFDKTFDLAAYANASCVQTRAISLGSRESATVTLTWNTSGFAKGKYTIAAVASTVLGETDTSDNTFVTSTVIYVVMPGDANHDGVINIFDIVTLASRWGSKTGDQNYDSVVDWNNDGMITIFDAVLCARHYGEKYP